MRIKSIHPPTCILKILVKTNCLFWGTLSHLYLKIVGGFFFRRDHGRINRLCYCGYFVGHWCLVTQHISSLLHDSVTTGILASYQPFNMHQYIQLFIVRVLFFSPLWPNAAFCAIVSTSLYLQKLLTFLSLKQHLLTHTYRPIVALQCIPACCYFAESCGLTL